MRTPLRFRACASAYWLLCGPFALIAILWLSVYLESGDFEWAPVAIGAGGAAAWALWLSRFQLDLGASTFGYQSLTYRLKDAAYADVQISTAHANAASRGQPELRLKSGAKLPINFRVFAKEAGKQFFERASREV